VALAPGAAVAELRMSAVSAPAEWPIAAQPIVELIGEQKEK